MREVRVWGDILPPSADIRLEGPWAFQEAWHDEHIAAGRGMRYVVTVALKLSGREGTISFVSTEWPGIVEMSNAIQQQWYVERGLADAVARYCRDHLNNTLFKEDSDDQHQQAEATRTEQGTQPDGGARSPQPRGEGGAGGSALSLEVDPF